MKKPSEDLQPHNSIWLTIEDFEFVCFNITRELMTFKEPIPDYLTRDNALLESALGSPRQTFDQQLLYPTLADQTAILFYSLIKNHPFKNGNKRIAVMALLVFLSLNGKWLKISPLSLYKMACFVSVSRPKEKDFILKGILGTIENNVMKLHD